LLKVIQIKADWGIVHKTVSVAHQILG